MNRISEAPALSAVPFTFSDIQKHIPPTIAAPGAVQASPPEPTSKSRPPEPKSLPPNPKTVTISTSQKEGGDFVTHINLEQGGVHRRMFTILGDGSKNICTVADRKGNVMAELKVKDKYLRQPSALDLNFLKATPPYASTNISIKHGLGLEQERLNKSFTLTDLESEVDVAFSFQQIDELIGQDPLLAKVTVQGGSYPKGQGIMNKS